MIFGYLMTAMLSGILGAGIWLITGGSLWGAFGVYMMTGHIAMAAMFAQSFFRDPDFSDEN